MSDPTSVLLSPCPFCEGPPVPIVADGLQGRGYVAPLDDYGPDGRYITAYVFCHECGTVGPHQDDTIYDREGYYEAERAAVRAWQERDSRHRCMYDDGAERGLNRYPRPDDSQWSEADRAELEARTVPPYVFKIIPGGSADDD